LSINDDTVFMVSLRLPKLDNATLTKAKIARRRLFYEGMYMFDKLRSIARNLKRELKVYKLERIRVLKANL
jgi:hypothetical protein